MPGFINDFNVFYKMETASEGVGRGFDSRPGHTKYFTNDKSGCPTMRAQDARLPLGLTGWCQDKWISCTGNLPGNAVI